MKQYFGYIRVSTVKQGEHGSSLQEQRDAITHFATRQDLHLAAWFEERETAAKIGRREFTRMVAALKKGKASGVIFHKIDRSARNLKDWSAVQDLADLGIDVRFAQESVNLGSNEGKLTGDFLAVIAAHYIRNLREEVRKGIRGRLKQGLYPFQAHIGYLDQGAGKPKTHDPQTAPFIRIAFELYATGEYSLHALAEELYGRGFRNRSGDKVGLNRIAEILRNPFYMGIIRMKRSGEVYAGVHEPIITKALFSRVQEVLNGKLIARTLVHDFQFRRMLTCKHCEYSLVGETRKGHVYYRCHTRTCPTTSIREDVVCQAIKSNLMPLGILECDVAELKERALSMRVDAAKAREDQLRAVDLRLEVVSGRLARLMDAYLDGAVDRNVFEEKKLALLMDRRGLEDTKAKIAGGEQELVDRILEYLGLLKNLPLSYEIANAAEKRKLLKTITSDFRAGGKNIAVELKNPFREIARLNSVRIGGPVRGRPRTKVKQIFNLLVKHCKAHTDERQREEDALIAA
jgi:site-specific DNA recombinase